jgi:hypothetical protein
MRIHRPRDRRAAAAVRLWDAGEIAVKLNRLERNVKNTIHDVLQTFRSEVRGLRANRRTGRFVACRGEHLMIF